MALIGEMQYLTIGGNTYSIPTSGGSTVTITRALTSGTKSATISVDGTSYDLYAPTPNAGTVTSVRVQATSPVQSSTSTAQSSTLNTTISLVDGYGDTKNPYGTKTANYVLAGPSSGSAAVPSFRALVAADIPDLSGTYLTSHLTGTGAIDVENGQIKLNIRSAISSGTDERVIFIAKHSVSGISGLNIGLDDGSMDGEYLFIPDWDGVSTASQQIINLIPTQVSDLTNDAGYITSADVPEGASAYTGTISAVSTTASNGTNNGFARGDHVHNITSSTITSALGYTPYDSSNPDGYISSYTDEKLKWTASTTSNTFYPLQSTSTATTSTANTLNGISFYQYYNTAGGYRRLILGNSTAYTSTGGAYGTIRLYGTGATYYGDINPGTLGANRTWTLPNATGTIALTSDIPTTLPASDVSAWAKASSKPSYAASEISLTGYTNWLTVQSAIDGIVSDLGDVENAIPTKTSDLTNDSGFITASHTSTYSLPLAASGTRGGVQIGYSESGTNYAVKLSSEKMYVTVPWTDTKLQVAAVTSGTTYYPIVGTGTTAATRQYDTTGFVYVGTNGTANGSNGNALLTLGNSTASTTANWKKGTVRLYGTTTYYTDLVSGAPSANRTITFPNATGTVALTSDIPTISYPVTSVNSKTGAVSLTASDVGALPSSTTIPSSFLMGVYPTSGSSDNTQWTQNFTTRFYFKSGDNISLAKDGSTLTINAIVPTVPTITLNGSSTTFPSFYAPTSAGASGQVLTSNGSGAPTWVAASSGTSVQIVRW